MDCATRQLTDAKQCTVCNRVLPAAMFGRHRQAPDGLRCRCKCCIAVENRAYRARMAGRPPIPQVTWCPPAHCIGETEIAFEEGAVWLKGQRE